MSQYLLWDIRDRWRVGDSCPDSGIGPVFGQDAIVDDHLFLRGPSTLGKRL